MRKDNLILLGFLLLVGGVAVTKVHSLTGLPSVVSQNSTWETPWGKLFENEPPRDDPPGGSRSNVCPIAPAVPMQVRVVWSDRPLFIWKGSVGRIELRLQGSQQALWSQKITESQNSVSYGGEALQAGQSYDWVLFDERDRPQLRVTFQVMGGEERKQVTADLNRLEMQLKQQGATAEKIAYARAKYFASRQLWADVLQEVYGVKNPSQDLIKLIQTIPQRFCPE